MTAGGGVEAAAALVSHVVRDAHGEQADGQRIRQVSVRGEQSVRLLRYPNPITRSLNEEKDHAVPLLRRPHHD